MSLIFQHCCSVWLKGTTLLWCVDDWGRLRLFSAPTCNVILDRADLPPSPPPLSYLMQLNEPWMGVELGHSRNSCCVSGLGSVSSHSSHCGTASDLTHTHTQCCVLEDGVAGTPGSSCARFCHHSAHYTVSKIKSLYSSRQNIESTATQCTIFFFFSPVA